MQVYQIGSNLSGDSPVIAVAHPDHLPRVYRAMKAGGADMSGVYNSIDPYTLDWYEGKQQYNFFKADKEVWKSMSEDTRGMFPDSVQQWCRDAMTFSIGEFWVYALQMIPGR